MLDLFGLAKALIAATGVLLALGALRWLIAGAWRGY